MPYLVFLGFTFCIKSARYETTSYITTLSPPYSEINERVTLTRRSLFDANSCFNVYVLQIDVLFSGFKPSVIKIDAVRAYITRGFTPAFRRGIGNANVCPKSTFVDNTDVPFQIERFY